MGATWRASATVIIAILQIQALISVKTKVTGVDGQRYDFICKYQDGYQSSAKYFRNAGDNVLPDHLIWTDKHDQWVRDGRFSLYDNTTGVFFIVRVDKLISEDSGTYCCGVNSNTNLSDTSVVQLNVSRATVSPIFVKDFTMDKLHLPLYLTAVMCVAAILSVCLFTLCLLLPVQHRRSDPRHNRETSSDYETMMPDVGFEPELCSSCSDPVCDDLSALPPPSPDLCSHFTSKHGESTVTLGLGDYVNMDVPGYICQYQHLDLSRLEEHVYHSLHGISGPKDGPLGVKEQVKC